MYNISGTDFIIPPSSGENHNKQAGTVYHPTITRAHRSLDASGNRRALETVWLDFGPAMKSAEYLAINPMGKVPALIHGAALVAETAAICAYLADRFPEKNLIPKLSRSNFLLKLMSPRQ